MGEKSAEKRNIEKERIEAETQRSLAVAEMKKAHKKIEDVEKIRRRSAILSVCNRIECTSKILFGFANLLINSPAFGKNPILDNNLKETILFEGKQYESIYFDFQKTLEINDQTMENLFPKIDDVEGVSCYEIAGFFNRVGSQMNQMKIYCGRHLI